MKRALMLTLLIALVGCSKSDPPADQSAAGSPPGNPQPEEIVEDEFDLNEMDAAIARAQSEVDRFITELSNPTGIDHAVKAPVQDNGQEEHFWLSDLTFKDGEFTGKVSDEPQIVQNVKVGQELTVKKDDISDWVFMRDGKMYGNYTTRALIGTMTPEEAADFKALIAEP